MRAPAGARFRVSTQEENEVTTTIPARLLGVREAGQYLSIGRSTVYELLARGELESVRIGDRRLIKVEDLDDYVNRLRAAS